MLIFDQLKKDDPQLRVLAMFVLSGLGILLAGLWWVQVVSVRDYQANLETQSFRTVRMPAVRGKILDRNGTALAENRPTYNVSLYLEELDMRKSFGQRSISGKAALRQRNAVAVENPSAHRRDAHRPEGLRLQICLVIPRRHHLNPPAQPTVRTTRSALPSPARAVAGHSFSVGQK